MSRLVLCAFALLFCGTAARATTYYVGGPSGNDSNTGTTLTTAWATIGKANLTLVAGDTVIIRGGTYTDEQILPTNSGASASLSITYRNYPGEIVTLNGGPETQADISNRNWIVISGLVFTGARGVGALASSHCTVEDCTFTSTTAPFRRWEEINIRNNSSYITVRNCLFDESGSGSNTNGDCIYVEDSSYTLIDSCGFGYSRHYGVNFGGSSHHAIVKNCTGQNPWHANMGAVGNILVSPTLLKNIVLEDNRVYDAGIEESTSPGDTGANNNNLEMQSCDCIIRRNIFDVSADPGNPNFARGMAIASWNFTVTGNRIYNNIISNNPLGCFVRSGSAANYLQDNVWKNNIFYQNTLNDVQGFYLTTTDSSLFRNNNFYSSVSSQYKGYTGTYAQMEAPDKFPTEWQNNLGSDPLFMNAAGRDFSLQAGSPMIDAGDHLTVTTGSGSSSTLVGVADAKYFCDGFGIAAGDLVQIGGNAAVQITAVNYTANQITLESPITWNSGDGVSLPYVGSRPDVGVYEYEPAASIILDNADSINVAISGSWTASSLTGGYYGSNYIHDGGTGTPRDKSVQFTPTISADGMFDVYARWTASANRATNVPIDVHHATGTTTLTVNQQNNNGTWVSLGTYPFATGATGNVTIRNYGANGYVIADAVKFVAAPIILDNVDSTHVAISGTWTASSLTGGYYGSDYIHDGGTGAPRDKSVQFTPTIPAAGTYDVYARWTASANRATNVLIDVHYATGTATLTVNQQNNNGTWVWLGSFPFAAGTTGNVTVRNYGANGYVIADAVMFAAVQ